MAWFAISLTLPIVAAYAWAALCDRGARGDVATFFLRLCLAIGVTIGISSGAHFLWLVLAGNAGDNYVAVELAVFSAVGLVGWAWLRATASRQSPYVSGKKEASPRLLAIAFVVALILAASGAAGIRGQAPLGEWDAWAIWNLRAHGLFRGGDQWRQAFSTAFAHPDYPLLLPCSNARVWSYMGVESDWTPWFLGSLFTFATVGILTAGVSRLRSASQGLLAGLTLLGTISFLHRGAVQYADVPLSFFMLAAVLLLALRDASRQPCKRMLFVSGLMAGLAAWTKNEGLLFFAVLLAVRGGVVWLRSGPRAAFDELACWIAGACPMLAILAIQKTSLQASNDVVSGQGWEATIARILDPSRYWYVAQSLVSHALYVAKYFAVILPLCFLLLGVAKNRTRGLLGRSTASATFWLMLAGYFMVYILTPLDLQWHLGGSCERLLDQLLPLGVLVLFLHLATPEEVWASEATVGEEACDEFRALRIGSEG